MSAVEDVLAAQDAERARHLEVSRRHMILFALEAVSGDGVPRVSQYTTAHLVERGLIEPVEDGRFRLTAEGRIVLHANPAGDDDLGLFGEAAS